MFTARHAACLVTALALALSGCTEDGGAGQGTGVSTPIGDEPLSDEDVTLHLIEPPALPAELDGAEITTSELRAADLTERHTVELVDVPEGTTTVAEAPVAGAFYRVAEGQTLEVGSAVDTAPLTVTEESIELGDVTAGCAAPCAVTGPALVGADGWMAGFGVEASWLLLVPSPIG